MSAGRGWGRPNMKILYLPSQIRHYDNFLDHSVCFIYLITKLSPSSSGADLIRGGGGEDFCSPRMTIHPPPPGDMI